VVEKRHSGHRSVSQQKQPGSRSHVLGIMSFVMHEFVYFGRSIPWIVIDAIPYFRRYKLQDVPPASTLTNSRPRSPHHRINGHAPNTYSCNTLQSNFPKSTSSIRSYTTLVSSPMRPSHHGRQWHGKSQSSLSWKILSTTGSIVSSTGVLSTRTSIKSTISILHHSD
jgi:hypothetical protein